MAYYKYSSTTGQLSEISDFQLVPDGEYVVSANEVSRSDLEKYYEWDSYSLTFRSKVNNTITKRDFLKRLTATEYGQIKSACETNATLDFYWQIIMSGENVVLNDESTTSAFEILDAFNIMTTQRIAEILA